VSKSLYNVPFVERKLLSLWHDFWDGNGPSAEARQANTRGELGRVEPVEAANKAEAAEIVARMHPDCVVIRDAIGRIGD
jgi:hypothetical protein